MFNELKDEGNRFTIGSASAYCFIRKWTLVSFKKMQILWKIC